MLRLFESLYLDGQTTVVSSQQPLCTLCHQMGNLGHREYSTLVLRLSSFLALCAITQATCVTQNVEHWMLCLSGLSTLYATTEPAWVTNSM